MSGQRRATNATTIWHALLIFAFSSALSFGFGGTAQIFMLADSLLSAGFLSGTAGGLIFCLFVFVRTRWENQANIKRSGPAVHFPRFALNVFRYGILTAAAGTLGFLTWTGLEDIALGRPLEGEIEMALGIFACLGVGSAAFFVLLRLLESD